MKAANEVMFTMWPLPLAIIAGRKARVTAKAARESRLPLT